MKRKEVARPTRAEMFNKWRDKSREWLMDTLYKERCAGWRERQYARINIDTSATDEVLSAAEELGLPVQRLEITFLDHPCERCECNDGDSEACYGCAWKEPYILTESFYDYAISHGVMNAITKALKKEKYKVVKVVDLKTGRVVYEGEAENEDE